MSLRNTDANNILFIQVDQMAASALSMYGNPACITPNLDKLADAGVVFENAYCNYPLCAPSRFSMAAGLMPSKIGAFDNGAEFPAGIPTYAHYLRANGYNTILSGKMHFVGPDQLHGFEQRLTADLYPADFQWVPNWRETVHQDVTDSRMLKMAGVCVNNAQIEYDERTCFEAQRKLLQLAKKADQRPFFMQVSFTHPHDPYMCKQAYWDLYEGVDIPLPTTPASAIVDRDPHSQTLLRQSGLADCVISDEEITRARRAYYGAISFIDEQIGKLIGILEQTNMIDNTVIVFTSDHGEMLGERGMWLKKNFFEPALRVPFLIHAPQHWSSRRISDTVSLVDLLPTLVSIATEADNDVLAEPLDGIDLSAMIDNNGAGNNRFLYGEITCEGTPSPMFMVRQGDYKYIYCNAQPAQLYKLDSDPSELINLAGNPDHATIENKLKNETFRNWNIDDIARQVVLSQSRRGLINTAFKQGLVAPWDYQPRQSDSDWFRGASTYNEWAYSPLYKSNK